MTNLITAAVAPLKSDAMDRAEQTARKWVASVTEKLVAANQDMDVAFAYPRNVWAHDYKVTKAAHSRASMIVKSRLGSRRMSEPHLVDVSAEYVESYVARCRDAAAAQYDAFVVKLIGKVGEHTAVELSGNHVWGHSILTVNKADGSVQKWKTQMILNVSVNGLLFNQWPTRLVK